MNFNIGDPASSLFLAVVALNKRRSPATAELRSRSKSKKIKAFSFLLLWLLPSEL
jgi:hypothetical protein